MSELIPKLVLSLAIKFEQIVQLIIKLTWRHISDNSLDRGVNEDALGSSLFHLIRWFSNHSEGFVFQAQDRSKSQGVTKWRTSSLVKRSQRVSEGQVLVEKETGFDQHHCRGSVNPVIRDRVIEPRWWYFFHFPNEMVISQDNGFNVLAICSSLGLQSTGLGCLRLFANEGVLWVDERDLFVGWGLSWRNHKNNHPSHFHCISL